MLYNLYAIIVELQKGGLKVALPAERLFLDQIELLKQLELEAPIYIETDDTIRAKTTDHCGMTCKFCHNEGTPVVSRLGTQALRVSIYEDSNGVNFLPGEMRPDDKYVDTLIALRDRLGTRELHWTGGEPTLSPHIIEMTRVASQELGMRVKMTSNGELGARKIRELAEAGLSSVNFSIFGTNAAELSAVQAMAIKSQAWADRKLVRLNDAILEAVNCGIKVGANVVVSGPADEARATNIIESYPKQVTVRLQADLENQQESWESIFRVLSGLGAYPTHSVATAGASSVKVVYELPDGKKVDFKRFMDVKLPDSCSGCIYNNAVDCKEGFYGLRLYTTQEGEYKVGICLRRMDLTADLDDFLNSSLPQEIQGLRSAQYEALVAKGPTILHERMG